MLAQLLRNYYIYSIASERRIVVGIRLRKTFFRFMIAACRGILTTRMYGKNEEKLLLFFGYHFVEWYIIRSMKRIC